MLNIAVAGLGTVGAEVVRLLQTNADMMVPRVQASRLSDQGRQRQIKK